MYTNGISLVTAIITNNGRAQKTMLKHLLPLVQDRQTSIAIGKPSDEGPVGFIPSLSDLYLTSPSTTVYSGSLILHR